MLLDPLYIFVSFHFRFMTFGDVISGDATSSRIISGDATSGRACAHDHFRHPLKYEVDGASILLTIALLPHFSLPNCAVSRD
jgi:hypothetical protein